MRHPVRKLVSRLRLLFLLAAMLAPLLAGPPAALAAQAPKVKADARYYGLTTPDARPNAYNQTEDVQVELNEGGSVALTYLLLVVLGGFCIGAMFKSAKRTHLD